jgi:hypothetical protein
VAPAEKGRSALAGWPGAALVTGAAVLLMHRAWGPRLPAGDDVTAHLVRAQFGLSQLVLHGKLDGWFPRLMVGHQEFLFYGPGFVWLQGLVRAGTFGLLSLAGATKVLAVVGVVGVAPAMIFLARSLDLDWPAAVLAGVLALAVDNVYGVGLQGTFTTGLLPQQVAAPLVLVAVGASLRTLSRDGWRWPSVVSISLAAMALTHTISVAIFAFFVVLALAAMLIHRRPPWSAWRRLLVAGAFAVGICGFWVVPFLAHRNLHGPVATWSTPPFGERMSQVWHGTILIGPKVAAILMVGMLWAALRSVQRRPYALLLLAGPMAFVGFSYFVLRQFPHNEIAVQLLNRGEGYAALLAMLPVADLAAEAGRRWRRAGDAAAAVAVIVVVFVLPGKHASWRTTSLQQGPPSADARAVARELRRVVPSGGKFATERDFPAEISLTGVPHPDIWFGWASGRDTLNAFNIESSFSVGPPLIPEELAHVVPEQAADDLSAVGVTDVVTVRADTTELFSHSPKFRPELISGALGVFAIDPVPPVLTPVHGNSEHLRGEVSGTDGNAVVPLSWSPKWHATLDGRPVHSGFDGRHLLEVAVPDIAPHRVELRFKPDVYDRLGVLVTLLTLLGLLGYASSSRMSSRRSRTA